MEGMSLAWALATSAACCARNEKPLPQGISEARVGRWIIVVNNSKLELPATVNGIATELPPFEVAVAMPEFVVFGLLGPAGGMIGGGVSEDEFIADMVAFLPPDELAIWGDAIEKRNRLS
jgi:hypothetical protein